MNKPVDTIRKILPIFLLAVAIGALALPSASLGQSVPRDFFQPIVVSGASLEAFVGVPTDQIFVYAYRDGTWVQIPHQIDEKAVDENGDRVYTAAGNGQLDVDEELVFMLKDMGQWAPLSAWVDGADEDSRIQVMAERADGSRQWAYVFRGAELAQTFTQRYVRFSGVAQRIIAERYEAGFLDNGAGLNELRLNDSGVNILDRTKLRLHVVVFGVVRRTVTEDDIEGEPFAPVKDGPVRLIRGERGGFAYGALFQEQSNIDLSDLPIPGVSVERFRFSWDFNEQVLATATPTIYLDANLSEPVVIDGQPDDVPDQPVPAWRQISHATGTLIMVSDPSSVGGTQRNYYKDDAKHDPDDTGDQRSYGDVGFSVENPNERFTLETSLLVLPPTWDNVGAAYAALLAGPPDVSASRQIHPSRLDRWVYLPLIRR